METQISTYLLYALYVITSIQGIFIIVIFPRIIFYSRKKKETINSDEGVSVVIAAKDEYVNLKKFLPKILQQNHPNFEVIVVNNGSEDDSEYLLKEMMVEYPILKYINVHSDANFFEGKKFPLSIGIKSAKNDLILLTDADCYPASAEWINSIISNYDPNTEIVLGYGAYEEKPGLLNLLIRFDTLRVAILYFSFAVWKIPYMGVGRNLSYRKSLFFRNKGFMSHYKTASGDDDLFINKAATRKNTSISLNADSKTISIPKEHFKDWLKQKRRHFTTGKSYKKHHLFLLGLWEMSTLFYFILVILLLSLGIHINTVLYIVAGRTLINIFLIKKITNVFGERKLLLLSPVLEFIIVLLGTLINMSNMLYKQRKWK